MKINVVTLCSGYDSQCMALERLKANYPDFDYNLIAWAEIDKFACKAHDAVFPQYRGRNLGDITKADWSKITEPIDLLFYSTPCQSISNAGRQEGLRKDSGTASSIIWSVASAIKILRPKYLILENVKALTEQKFEHDFKAWQREVASFGYNNFIKVLNAKNYGVPQNRERVFMVSCLDDIHYQFPKEMPLDRNVGDILQKNVDKKYFLSKTNINYLKRHNYKVPVEVAKTIMASCYKSSKADNYVVIHIDEIDKIRKLTPKECFRLMGVSGVDISKIQAAGISNSQQYKLAGNSIVVDVLFHLFRKLFIDRGSDDAQLSLF